MTSGLICPAQCVVERSQECRIIFIAFMGVGVGTRLGEENRARTQSQVAQLIRAQAVQLGFNLRETHDVTLASWEKPSRGRLVAATGLVAARRVEEGVTLEVYHAGIGIPALHFLMRLILR